MAAPAHTVWAKPSTGMIPDGYKTVLAFAAKSPISLFLKGVKPPGIDGGDKIDTTTMVNDAWRTAAARHLKTLTDPTFTAAFDPDVYSDLMNLVNNNGSITAWFADGSSIDFYGYLQKCEPNGEFEEGKLAELTGTVVATNTDPSTGLEQGPVFNAAVGT